MARIAGVDLPREKRVEIGLTYIYGIGVASSNEIVLPELDKRDYVERYSWFSFSKSDFKNSGSALLDTYTGKLTGLGKLYQKLGIPEGYQDNKQVEQKDNIKKDIVK